MPGTAGRKARISVGQSSGGPYTVIAGVKSFTHSIEGASIDDSELGVDWVQRVIGLKDGKISITGQRRLADTNGQNALIQALLAGNTQWIKVLPDNGTTTNVGYYQEMLVSKFQQDDAVDGVVNISVELEGTGAVTVV